MPAKKLASLMSQHDAKSARATRADAEAAYHPKNPLLLNPPARLKGYQGAGALWRQTIEMYRSLEVTIVSALDQDMLVDYCILGVQLVEMDGMRASAQKSFRTARALLERYSERKDVDPKLLIKWQDSVNWAEGVIVKIDARVDRKRALLHTLRQSLYMTPRSRAGVAPPEKPPEKPKTEMEKFLDGS